MNEKSVFRMKIYGAGSIGNHLAHAARSLGGSVVVCDVDPRALHRMRTEIYPSRYGAWDDTIELTTNDSAPRGGFDIIFVGTPPDTHMDVALAAAEERPRSIIIEKPLCTPDLRGAQELYELSLRGEIAFFVGYDHVVGYATEVVDQLLQNGIIGEVQTIDVEFREHWAGIFAAHPWLAGPHDSYLGFSTRGGGATGEHSHAINLWQHFAHTVGAGRVAEVTATMRHVKGSGGSAYDDISLVNLRTERGLLGRVVQDVVTRPQRKRAVIQGTKGAVHWVCGHSPEGDAVIVAEVGKEEVITRVPKRRPDDFIRELQHVISHLESSHLSALNLTRGLDTMLVVAAAFRSDQAGSVVRISPAPLYTADAFLQPESNLTTSHVW